MPRLTSFNRVLPKGDDGMPCPTPSNRQCCPKAMMACHARRRPPVCAVQRQRCHASPDDADRVCYPRALMSCHARSYQPCVLSKGGDVMPRPTLPTVCFVQGRSWHATPDVVRPCVLSKGDYGMPRPTFPNHVYYPWAMMECHDRHYLFVCSLQE